MEDQDIVNLYWQRNEQAITETDRKYGRLCHGIAGKIVSPSDADECVNDTWLKTWNALPPEKPTLLGAYVAKIVRRLALNIYAASHAQKRGNGEADLAMEELEEVLSDGSSTEQEADAALLRDAIQTFLEQQSEENRKIFLQRYWYMRTVNEIARDTHRSVSAVKMILMRMRNGLKDELVKGGFYEED
ncbi:RNA polymerase sigma factor [Galactobacillus timonensis]|uniref:RNA polymerase sigma factor n=1 Tax=Galactobacillus timonensis TaxID=2041840 RepID=UPI000C83458A|nr:sigma-70 family RNA polymerase sigma factor [Galactobacillus timonensis]